MNNKLTFYVQPFSYIKSYRDMIDTAVEYGLSSVEGFSQFEFSEPDTEAAKRIREYADSKGIVFPCFSVGINLVSEDSALMIDRIMGYARVAQILGSDYLHHTIAPYCSNPEQVLRRKNEYFNKGIACVREICDYVDSLGIKAVYEDQGYIFNGTKNFRSFLDEVDRNVGVVADFGNIYQVGEEISDFINSFSSRIVHVHIKDITVTEHPSEYSCETVAGQYVNEADIGRGCIDISGAINLLKKAGYRGYYGIEYATRREYSDEIRRMLDYLNAILLD